MAKKTNLSNDARSAGVDAIVDLLGPNPRLKIYTGTMPASPSTGLSGNTLLANFELDDPAFAAAVNGVASAETFDDVTALADGTATWCSLTTAGGARKIEGTVGVSAGTYNLVVNTTTFVTGGLVSISSLTITIPASYPA